MEAARTRVGQHLAAERRDVELRAVGVVRVLDQHPAVVEGQRVEEPEAVGLRDARVHQHRVRQAVGCSELELEPHELLEGDALEALEALWAPSVHHQLGLETPAALELDATPIHADRRVPVSRVERGLARKRASTTSAKRFPAGDGRVRGVQRAAAIREEHVVALPALRHEGAQERRPEGVEIGGVEAPGVIAAGAGAGFDHGHPRVGQVGGSGRPGPPGPPGAPRRGSRCRSSGQPCLGSVQIM